MTEKEILKQEIEQILQEQQARRRKGTIEKRIALTCMIILAVGLFVLGVVASNMIAIKEAKNKFGPIAGTYELYDIDVLDPFEKPDISQVGKCTISDTGGIEFPYYDGYFSMKTGQLVDMSGPKYDYEIEVEGYEVTETYLNLEGVNGIRIHMHSTPDREYNESWRELEFVFFKEE